MKHGIIAPDRPADGEGRCGLRLEEDAERGGIRTAVVAVAHRKAPAVLWIVRLRLQSRESRRPGRQRHDAPRKHIEFIPDALLEGDEAIRIRFDLRIERAEILRDRLVRTDISPLRSEFGIRLAGGHEAGIPLAHLRRIGLDFVHLIPGRRIIWARCDDDAIRPGCHFHGALGEILHILDARLRQIRHVFLEERDVIRICLDLRIEGIQILRRRLRLVDVGPFRPLPELAIGGAAGQKRLGIHRDAARLRRDGVRQIPCRRIRRAYDGDGIRIPRLHLDGRLGVFLDIELAGLRQPFQFLQFGNLIGIKLNLLVQFREIGRRGRIRLDIRPPGAKLAVRIAAFQKADIICIADIDFSRRDGVRRPSFLVRPLLDDDAPRPGRFVRLQLLNGGVQSGQILRGSVV